MRIGCPNCDALYEVDDTAIPPGGRDVQCSNCGHGWFQRHPEAEAAEAAEAAVHGAAAAVAEPPPEVPAAPPAPAIAPSVASAPADADDPAEDDSTVVAPIRRTLDESLLAVLREEAAREAEARRRDAERGVEVQPDLGLPAAPPRRAEPAAEPTAPPATDRPQRRDLLPDIEEINSTLRPGAEARGEEAEAAQATEAVRRRSFRSGFVTMVAVFVVLALLYVLAPRLGQAVPALKGPLDGYIAAIDALRVWLDGAMQSAAGLLRGVSGQEG